ncbi:MAG TPA: hypothetical protein VK097_12955 [Lentibacillus sp.]|uniref:hypothetical protein n=1 Tax=Lentibacillus sp. TaxID=1925746 RepID=UPI002B4ABB91|nr:hypothetical protein [Lentibacillus sp.]HLR63332.1 hypothetical protein [Lentibacillus sp.]
MGQDQNKKPSEMNPEDLPDVRAFSDEFTLDFLQSTEETRDGYYPFLSGTGNYKVDFPAEGEIDERMYSIKEKRHEEVPISIKDDTGFSMQITYYSHHKADQINSYLENFKLLIGYDGDFRKLEKKNQSLYYTGFERNGFRSYAGNVQNEKGTGGIEVVYDIDCRDKKEKTCSENKQDDEERVMEWLESVQFVNAGEK